jgi:hypothetical protein
LGKNAPLFPPPFSFSLASPPFYSSYPRHPRSTPINEEKARNDARALYKAGVGKLGTDESKFNEILCSRSYPQLRLTFEEYAKVHGAVGIEVHITCSLPRPPGP